MEQGQGWRPKIFKYETDLEDEDCMPHESEFEEVDANDPITEAKELWNNVWAYCADCGE